MPAAFSRIDINLIGADDFSKTPVGRLVTWATTYGRYIMILTEIIVLLAFISRFSLDRKLTDLNEEIAQKQAIIETNSPLEQEIRTIQQQLQNIKQLVAIQANPITTLKDIQNMLPPDVYLDSLNIETNKATMSVIAGTTQGIASFLGSLVANQRFTNIELGDITTEQLGGSRFDITLQIGKTQQKPQP